MLLHFLAPFLSPSRIWLSSDNLFFWQSNGRVSPEATGDCPAKKVDFLTDVMSRLDRTRTDEQTAIVYVIF